MLEDEVDVVRPPVEMHGTLCQLERPRRIAAVVERAAKLNHSVLERVPVAVEQLRRARGDVVDVRHATHLTSRSEVAC